MCHRSDSMADRDGSRANVLEAGRFNSDRGRLVRFLSS